MISLSCKYPPSPPSLVSFLHWKEPLVLWFMVNGSLRWLFSFVHACVKWTYCVLCIGWAKQYSCRPKSTLPPLCCHTRFVYAFKKKVLSFRCKWESTKWLIVYKYALVHSSIMYIIINMSFLELAYGVIYYRLLNIFKCNHIWINLIDSVVLMWLTDWHTHRHAHRYPPFLYIN